MSSILGKLGKIWKWTEELMKRQNKSNQIDDWLIWEILTIIFLSALGQYDKRCFKQCMILQSCTVRYFRKLHEHSYGIRFALHVQEIGVSIFCCLLKYKYEKDLNLDIDFIFIFRLIYITIKYRISEKKLNWYITRWKLKESILGVII